MPDVITMGEVMVELNAVTRGPLRNVTLFEKHAGGAEGNVAIGVSRLGQSSGIITRIGNDEFGQFLLGTLKAENVDTSHVITDPDSPTGLFFIERGYPIPNRSSTIYYRHNSAGSKLHAGDIDSNYIASGKIFHVSGITPALSSTARQATDLAVKCAKQSKATVSVDTNVRLKLWTEEEARLTLLSLCKMADIVFTSAPDAKIILGEDDPMKIAKRLHGEGVNTVVVKLGDQGAFGSSDGETGTVPMIPTNVEDPTGAGDAFASAFLATRLKGWNLRNALRAGSATAALVATVRGDFESIPNMAGLQTFLDNQAGKSEYLR
jgi:sugar/nucleoside kinase (ribokinase family)